MSAADLTGPGWTGTGSARIVNCCAPEAAAEAGEPWPEPDHAVGEAAQIGTVIHELVEPIFMSPLGVAYDPHKIINTLALCGMISADLDVDVESVERRAKGLAEKAAERFKVDDWSLEFEQKHGFSPYGNLRVGFTGYEADADGHRNYEKVEDGDIALTTDLEAYPEFDDGEIVVVDFKTGRRENVTPARDNWQGLTAACAIRYGAHQAAQVERGEAPTPIRFELWFVDEGGNVEVDGWTYTDEQIEAAAVKLCETATQIRSGYSPPVLGDHCVKNWCKYRQVCPAQAQALATMGKKPIVIGPGAGLCEVTTEAQALQAIAVLPSVRKATRELDAALKIYTDANEVKRADGKRWEGKTSQSFAGLTDRGMVALAEIVEGEISMNEIAPRKLDRAALKRELGADRAAEIIEQIEQGGGIVKRDAKRYGWRK